MNKELKETNIPNNILVTLGDLANGALNYYKAPKTIKLKYKLLLDYITNLQEENRVLKELNVCVGCNNNPDYKSKIDKAIEIYQNRNSVNIKKKKFMEDKNTSDLMYEELQGSDEK